jgi:hypothetical protein
VHPGEHTQERMYCEKGGFCVTGHLSHSSHCNSCCSSCCLLLLLCCGRAAHGTYSDWQVSLATYVCHAVSVSFVSPSYELWFVLLKDQLALCYLLLTFYATASLMLLLLLVCRSNWSLQRQQAAAPLGDSHPA